MQESIKLSSQGLRRDFWIHPLTLFWAAWLSVLFLYDLHLSLWLIYPTRVVAIVIAWIVTPFSITILVYRLCSSWTPENRGDLGIDVSFSAAELNRRLRRAFAIWLILTLVEVVASGGVPLQWLLQGSPLTYVDFGIASVHGFLNSMILAIGLIDFAIFAITRRKIHLWLPALVVLWSIIAVTRNMLTIMLIECAIAWVMIRGINWKVLIKACGGLLVLVLAFGLIGDARTGQDSFRALAEPSENYPDWLPSGVLWVYIYVGTPVNNLVNTIQTTIPLHDYLFPNTTSLLFPSVVRKIIYNPSTIGEAVSGDLVTDSFNVSTAYVGAFQDFGLLGMACFSTLLAWVSVHYWHDRSLRGSLIYAVLGQCLAISIFFNHLFYLPVITQVFWIYLLLANPTSTPREASGIDEPLLHHP